MEELEGARTIHTDVHSHTVQYTIQTPAATAAVSEYRVDDRCVDICSEERATQLC